MLTKYKSIFLIGSNGWLGKRLVDEIIRNKKEILEVNGEINCLIQPGQPQINEEVKYFEGDIRSYEDCSRYLSLSEGALVVNVAGMIHPTLFTRDFKLVNLTGTKNLYEASKENIAKKFITISSNSPFGANLDLKPFTETSNFNPYMKYGISKMEMENYLASNMTDKNTPITILRTPWFYGPEQPSRQVKFFSLIKKGMFPIMGSGKYKRSLAYVDSIVSGILLSAFNKKSDNKVYWLSDDEPYYMIDIVESIKKVLREDFLIRTRERNLHVPAFISDVARLGDRLLQSVGLYNQNVHVLSEQNMNIFCSNKKIKDDLGFQPACTLEEGMRKSIDWCLSKGLKI